MSTPLHALLRCPQTAQPLVPAPPELIERLLASHRAGTLRNAAGEIPEPFENGLVTLDGARIYPIRGGIPVLLSGEAL
jgi:uncharacterized protein YbaR (Trm112 family)